MVRRIDLLFYGAPCVLLFHQSPYADPVDGHIACTYAMIAAESLGLGTCMIGWFDEARIKRLLSVPRGTRIGLVISIVQVVTQIQEMTLTFVPKVVAVAVIMLVAGPWMLNTLMEFTTSVYAQIPNMTASVG